MIMRTFRATTLQDASELPWVYELPPVPTAIPSWGVNIVPNPVHASYDEEEGSITPIGEPLYYEWSALLDPADTPLPSWITEVTEPENTLIPNSNV
jgi:hypothetical protein